MTENEKIELFDKWYDENYDEWAEGEEGIALREELEQAFKGGIAELEKENAELKKSVNNWLKYEKETQYHKSIIKDLKKENAELKSGCGMCYRKDKDQLTKAKELLRYYFDCFKNDNKYTLSDFEVVEDTEQFLSEVEK